MKRALLIALLGAPGVMAQSTPAPAPTAAPETSTSAHTIARADAEALVAAWKADQAKPMGTRVGKTLPEAFWFDRSAFDGLLKQKGAQRIKLHLALKTDGQPTLVAEALDAQGKALPLMMEWSFPCPPCM